MFDEELKRADKNKKSGTTAYRIGGATGIVKATAISVEQVNRRHSDGIQSLAALQQMLRQAAISAKGKVTSAAPMIDKWGVSFTIGNGLYWTGLNYSKSETLIFRALGADRNRAEEIGIGTAQARIPNKQDRRARSNRLDLESERVRSFAKTKSNQIECIERFLSESIRASTWGCPLG